MYRELDVIELTHDINKNNLTEGTRGTIVEIYKGGEAYEIEFISPDGTTSDLITLSPEDIRPIINRQAYILNGLDTPIYLSTESVAGTVVNSTLNDFPKHIYSPTIEVRTELPNNKASSEEFYHQSV